MHKQSICLLIPSLKVGGMERVMSQIANYLAKKDEFTVDLVMYGKKPTVFFPLDDTINTYSSGIEYQEKKRIWFSIKTLLYIRKKVRKLNPDIVISFGEVWNSFVLTALLGTSYPVFISDRCKPDRKYNQLNAFLRKWLYPKATGIIAQTEFAKQFYFKSKLNSNIAVIANPIQEKNKLVMQRQNIILSVGRLIQTKHHDRLIKVFSKLNAPDWKLIIAGGDALKQKNMEKLKILVTKLGLDDRVFLAGEIKDIDQYYYKSKIFAFTSSSEGFPNVVGEAMLAGLPVVSYDCVAGPSEMINEGENGFLVPLFDDQLMQERIQLLIDQEGQRERMSEKAQLSMTNFSIENIGDKFLKFILDESTSN